MNDVEGQWRTKDVVADAPAVAEQVVQQLGAERGWIESVLRDLRFVIDRFVADDVTVLAPPFLVRRRGDPVWTRLRDLPDEEWDKIQSFEDSHLAVVLDLDEDLVRRYPVVGEADVLWDLWDVRGHDLEAIQSGDRSARERAERIVAVVRTWLDLWDPERQEYLTSRIGLERRFQDWLVADLDRLTPFGLPLKLVKEEYRFADGRKADVICRATADSDLVRHGDLVVIENKAHMVDVHAYEQLRGYVELAAVEIAQGDQRVHGLLIADGRTLQLQEALHEAGYWYVSLSQIGFRDWLRGAPQLLTGEPVRDAVRDEAVVSERSPAAASAVTTTAPMASRRGPWVIGGVVYSQRRDANRALARELGRYTGVEWKQAQRQHGLL